MEVGIPSTLLNDTADIIYTILTAVCWRVTTDCKYSTAVASPSHCGCLSEWWTLRTFIVTK